MQGSGGLSDVNLLANGDFEEDGGWIFNSPAFIDESGEHAWSGHKCVCFGSPPANQVISIRQNGLPLEPGKQYTVRYRQKSTGSASTQTINPYPQVMYQVGTSYRAVRGDARRVYDEYTLTEWVFTLPEEARDSPSLDFFIIMPTSSWARNGMGHIDAVTLCEGAPEQSNVGKHGWLTMRDIPAYETPGGGKVRHRLDTSARILICDQTTIDGITWYQAGDFFYRLGWIRADCTSQSTPFSRTGRFFVKTNQERFWTLDQDFNRHVYYWPKGRQAQVTDYNDSYFQGYYNGEVAYQDKLKCDRDTTAVPAAANLFPIPVAEMEIGRTNSRYFDNAQGDDWSQAFVNWLILGAGYPRTHVSLTNDVEAAIVAYCTDLTPELNQFCFRSAAHKARLKQKYPALSGLADGLTFTDSFGGSNGSIAYFLWDEDLQDPSKPDIAASAAAFLISQTTDAITVIGAGKNGGPVCQMVFEKNDPQIIGYAVTNTQV